jgi:DNA-binding SARP family transcriptional activator
MSSYTPSHWGPGETDTRLWIRVLGGFSLCKADQPAPLLGGGKTEALISMMALRYRIGAPRETILALLWPNQNIALANQSLNSLIHGVRKQLSSALDGRPPLLYVGGCYLLNSEAGIAIDLAYFDTFAHKGDQLLREGDEGAAMTSYCEAVRLYRGDFSGATDIHAAVERERLRATYLTMLVRLADYHYSRAEYSAALDYVQRVLASDPCREDAYRLLMRCYVRLGERTQALRQYQLCADLLQTEFDAAPEPLTSALYDQVRHRPDQV